MPEPRTLIVEHDPLLRHGLCRALLDVDLFSDAASDAAEAVELLEARPYAIVVLDVDIAGGADAVIAAVQRMPLNARPIVIATAESRDRIGGLDAEAVQVVLRRPLQVSDVAELVRACIDTSARSRRRAEADELRDQRTS